MKFLITFTLTISSLALFMSSCELENADWTYSTDNTMSDLGFDDVYNLGSGEANSNNSLRSCGTVNIDTTPGTFFPVTMTIDFGSGTVCNDGRMRSGSITATYSDRWSTVGMTCTITPNNYSLSDHQVAGTIIISNQGLVGGSTTYRCEVTDGEITTPDGKIITRESVKYWSWIAGASTPLDTQDDAYQMTGTATGTTINGNSFTAEITVPVIKAVNCSWIQEGRVEVTPSNGSEVHAIDYGSGGCDDLAEVSYGKWSTVITMN